MNRRLLDWEPIDGMRDDEVHFHKELRARVPGGWLIKISSAVTSFDSGSTGYERKGVHHSNSHTSIVDAITFYPDPHHKWEPGPVDNGI